MSGTLGEDTAEVGARTWRAWILLVAFDFSLPTMGAAQGLLRGIPVPGGGGQSSVRRWALLLVVHHDGRYGASDEGGGILGMI